ncbi:hypothetical protein J6590_033636 [Homalodisca vitripennis]|nr:hypothetical protein J6590_033636 [Homalodisca vitripennis]
MSDSFIEVVSDLLVERRNQRLCPQGCGIPYPPFVTLITYLTCVLCNRNTESLEVFYLSTVVEVDYYLPGKENEVQATEHYQPVYLMKLSACILTSINKHWRGNSRSEEISRAQIDSSISVNVRQTAAARWMKVTDFASSVETYTQRDVRLTSLRSTIYFAWFPMWLYPLTNVNRNDIYHNYPGAEAYWNL